MLSAVVITKNEEQNLARCLRSLSFCDEIVVVDSESTDKTCEIAKSFTSKVFTRPWQGYAEQKNAANALATGDWILSLDADEEVSSQLREEIKSVTGSKGLFAAYRCPRQTWHSGRWIRYGGWYPNRLIRLFQKDTAKWVGGALHEYLQVAGPIGDLKGDLIHYSFQSISDQVTRNNRYSTLGAEKLLQTGVRFSLFKWVFKPVSKFIETYFLKLGFLDGYRGFIISVSAAYSVFLKWAKLWELQSGKKENIS